MTKTVCELILHTPTHMYELALLYKENCLCILLRHSFNGWNQVGQIGRISAFLSIFENHRSIFGPFFTTQF
jgi:hypothetical protein